MRKSVWCLWLNGNKVYDISQLRAFFDASALCGYFLGGSLIKWLISIEENELADKVNNLDPHGDITSQLAVIFGIKEPEMPPFVPTAGAAEMSCGAVSASSYNAVSSFSPAYSSFASIASYSSFGVNIASSFGSFLNSSFFNSSFSGSFSIAYGSSFSETIGSFSKTGSFTAETSINGSFSPDAETRSSALPENKLVENICLSPLNRYGYGIHII